MVANSRAFPFVLIIAAVALVISAGFLVQKITSHSGDGASKVAIRQPDTAPAPSVQDAAPLERGAASRHRPAVDAAGTAVIASVLREYQCPSSDSECRRSPFAATSEQEARWLRANGFPTSRELQEAQQMSLQRLDEHARSGNVIAQSVYADRLLKEGNIAGALGVSLHAANRGSLYALYQLAQVYAADGARKDPLTAKAYLRLAYLAGDYKVASQLANTFPEFNNPSEQAFVDSRAVELHRKLLSGKVTPRPIDQ